MSALPFRDRVDAGRRLADALPAEDSVRAVVVGLARGGVPVAAEVARALGAPLDALAVRKVGHPLEPEYGIGAVTPGASPYVRGRNGLSEAALQLAVANAQAAADELDRRLHTQRPALDIAGRTCVLVDDGLATGATMTAAVRWARERGAKRVVVAVPVGSSDTVARLVQEADSVVCPAPLADLGAVGLWYRDFRPVSDEEVIALLSDVAWLREAIEIADDGVQLPGELSVPAGARAAVVFAHGSGSSRLSPRNRLVATTLEREGLATLLFDLLTAGEDGDRSRVFDVPLLASRLLAADRFVRGHEATAALPIGYFGASTGAAAALVAAAERGDATFAVVSRGGRPDLAGARLANVRAPTLLLVGELDQQVLELNRAAAARLTCPQELMVVPRASHLFEEPGALEQVAHAAADWFLAHLPAPESDRLASGRRL